MFLKYLLICNGPLSELCAIYLLMKWGNLSCRISHILDLADGSQCNFTVFLNLLFLINWLTLEAWFWGRARKLYGCCCVHPTVYIHSHQKAVVPDCLTFSEAKIDWWIQVFWAWFIALKFLISLLPNNLIATDDHGLDQWFSLKMGGYFAPL